MEKVLLLLAAAALAVCSAACNTETDTGSAARSASSVTKNYTADNGNIVINGIELTHTGLRTVIASGTAASIDMKDDSSWSGYYTGSVPDFEGVFLKDRSVKLSAYSIGSFEVTQELYPAVVGANPSLFASDAAGGEAQNLRPVEQVSWYDAVVFCNKLSTLMGYEPCYTIVVDGTATADTAKWGSVPESSSSVWNAVVCDITKNGYRLPTEAEWEFAARGGNPAVPAWNYCFAGIPSDSSWSALAEDRGLGEAGWYSANSGGRTHQAGLKRPNTLGLYDMSGNVWEWCWDWYDGSATSSDGLYAAGGVTVNPLGPVEGTYHVLRGGRWYDGASYCSVSYRSYCFYSWSRICYIGFRLCRTGI